jgi:hypothetical protein
MGAPLADVLAAWRADAETLRRHGEIARARLLESCATAVEATPEWSLVEWVSEKRALTITGRSAKWLRGHRLEWVAAGVARETKRGWEYRHCILPPAMRVDDTSRDRSEDVRRFLGLDPLPD